MFQGVAPVGRLSCAIAPRAKCLMCLRSCATRPPRTSRLLSCHRSVGWPPLPRLTVKRAKVCDVVRMTLKRLIVASARSISAQTGCRPVRCLLSDAFFRDQSSAIPLHADRGSAHRQIHRPASLASQEIMRSTNQARDRRMSPLAQWGQHVDLVPVSRMRSHLHRNRRPSACRCSARHPSQRSP
jgi:hypothetical protein